jgi:5-methylcytosine-specific restriction endonuclease McrA
MKSNRKLIFDKYNGKCAYCGCNLTERFHIDHIKPIMRGWSDKDIERHNITKGDNDIENLNPACARCNLRKNSMSIEQFRSEILAQVERLKRDSNQYRLAVDYGLIIEEYKPKVTFYFEKL